jgi:hypothetical protein
MSCVTLRSPTASRRSTEGSLRCAASEARCAPSWRGSPGASLSRGEDETSWIARATQVTAEQLSKMVRAVDLGSVEAGALDEETARSRIFEVRCRADVRWKWYAARGAASRAAGRMLHVSEAAELIAAEVLSALPLDEDDVDEEACDEAEASWSGPSEGAEDTAREPRTAPVDRATCSAGGGYGVLEPLLVGLEHSDAFELDDRFRRALSMEQRLDARIGPLLAVVGGRWVHRALGYSTREAYVRERLGMDPTRARALVRLERAAVLSEPFARAWRTGALSWVKAGILVPLVSSDPLGRFMEDWVAWAKRVTVRRLRDDVEWALALEETDPAAFRLSGGLPREREIGATPRESGEDPLPRPEREIGAAPRESAEETCSVRFIGPADVVQLFRAVLCTVRRRMERDVDAEPARPPHSSPTALVISRSGHSMGRGPSSTLQASLEPDPNALRLSPAAKADEKALLELVAHLQAAEVDLLALPDDHLGRELLHAGDDTIAIQEV